MITVLQRMCWNIGRWKARSGVTFDSGNPGKYGYGNEEWNFCKDDALDGYVYGFLPWKPAQFRQEEHFQIWFWTIPPERKERLLVGIYHDASLATDKELRELDAYFKGKGIYKRRLEEVLAKVNRTEQKSHAKRQIPKSARELRFKCPAEKVEIFRPERILPRILHGKRVGDRFGKPTLPDWRITASSLSPRKGLPKLQYVATPLLETTYPRATAASLKIIRPKHKLLSNQFVDWLRRNGKTLVGREKDRVDVEFRDGASLCRAELKVCYGMNTTHGIREALGQLLEYNYYGWRSPAKRWYVVLDTEPAKEDILYLQRLTRQKLLPLSLCWRSGNDFQVIAHKS